MRRYLRDRAWCGSKCASPGGPIWHAQRTFGASRSDYWAWRKKIRSGSTCGTLLRESLYRATGSKFEQTLTLYEQAREFLPDRYRDLLRLRPPAVLKINLRNAYPRCHVTRRIRADRRVLLRAFCFAPIGGGVFGKLPRFVQNSALPDRDPARSEFSRVHLFGDENVPGACFAGCTKEEYDAEVALVVETLDTAGGALTAKSSASGKRPAKLSISNGPPRCTNVLRKWLPRCAGCRNWPGE